MASKDLLFYYINRLMSFDTSIANLNLGKHKQVSPNNIL